MVGFDRSNIRSSYHLWRLGSRAGVTSEHFFSARWATARTPLPFGLNVLMVHINTLEFLGECTILQAIEEGALPVSHSAGERQ
jgi:hypothetical protein